MSKIQTVTVCGDSVLKGVVLNETNGRYQALTNNCASMLQKCLDISIINKSHFGHTIDKGSRLLYRDLAQGLKSDVIVLEYGGNDSDFNWKDVSDAPELDHSPRTPLDNFTRMLSDMIQAVRKHGIEPILMSLPPVDGVRYLQYLTNKGMIKENLLKFLGDAHSISRFQESYSLAITRLAQEFQCIYVPVREAFLSDFRYRQLMCSDGIHPNQNGHLLMKKVFLDMVPAIRTRFSPAAL